jgi:hypothetical protein
MEERAAANRRLAKVAVQCSADTFVQAESSVLRMKFSGESRHLRQAPKRWWQGYKTPHIKIKHIDK